MDASEPGKAVAAEAGTHLASTTTLSRGPAAGRSRLLFGHTPRRRAAPPSPAPQENADPQKMAFLLRKQWALYSVTPLYKFSYANMKEYSRHLSAFVAAEKQKGLAMVVGIDLSIKVIFSTLLGLKGTDRDQAAILVQIASKTQTTSGKEEEKVVWSGWFCCVFGDELLENVPEDFICLPLFLANGAETYTAIIGTWFQKTFDCCFSRLAISPLNLAWMAAMWTGYKVDSHAVATELIFSVPCIPQRLDISYAIHPEDAQALWDTVQNTQGEVTQEEVDLFMDCLYSHFHRHFKIHLSATRLVKVSTSIASVHSDGNLKILQSKYLIGVLMLLTELAILQIQ
ncbi:centromere protein L isoform X1 [Alligator mississippiensis]|uniref:Centromere protein L n=1 Tax=Alligator mississippiensis TaxID=8496 RepID=A0A151MIH9_ALLMI|nr:centromere protein L isoform X1 [Alligator mississippiensis]KYO24335.1 centromere protein L isoform A [Alligator mississippiensis]